MFDWLRRKTPQSSAPSSRANPSRGVRVSIAFTNAERTWTEEVDLLSCMAAVLRSGGFSVTTGKASLHLEPGLVLQPGIVSFKPLQKSGVQTLTTVEVSCPPEIPAGVFDYQHSTGTSTLQSITKGFESWMQLDLPVFLDSLRTKPEHCTFLEFELPADAGRPAQKRRVVLGPVSHLVSRTAEVGAEEHPFCPCCLFTRSGDVMKPIIADGEFYGIRLFAMRDQDGIAGADCRLNGQDWEPGRKALMAYVESWPNRGVEFRKQYVILQNV